MKLYSLLFLYPDFSLGLFINCKIIEHLMESDEEQTNREFAPVLSFWLSMSCNFRPLPCLTIKNHSHYCHRKEQHWPTCEILLNPKLKMERSQKHMRWWLSKTKLRRNRNLDDKHKENEWRNPIIMNYNR